MYMRLESQIRNYKSQFSSSSHNLLLYDHQLAIFNAQTSNVVRQLEFFPDLGSLQLVLQLRVDQRDGNGQVADPGLGKFKSSVPVHDPDLAGESQVNVFSRHVGDKLPGGMVPDESNLG